MANFTSSLGKRIRRALTARNLVTGLALVFLVMFHQIVTENPILIMAYYVAVGLAAYALVKRGDMARLTLVVGTVLAVMATQVSFGGDQPGWDRTANIMTWCLLLLIFWMVGRHAYVLQVEAQKLRVQRQVDKIANEARNAALTCAAHELRTPLCGMVSTAEVLMEVDHALSDEESQFLTYIYECGQHLEALINDMLDYAKGQAGKIELSLEPTNVVEVIGECVDFVRIHSQKLQLEIRTNVEPAVGEIQADRLRLRQIILNLLSNAMKYSPPGSHIEVQVGIDSGQLRLGVIDRGQGMSAEQQAGLFQPFSQKGDVSGTGLGLAICKLLVELHEGTITVNSQPGSGTCFVVHLPVDGPGSSSARDQRNVDWRAAVGSEESESADSTPQLSS